jgi:signal transduction histidine kinase/integral membrane sensor domain MASE1
MVGAGYLLSAWVSLRLVAQPENVAVFWPAAGVASGLLIAFGRGQRLLSAAAVFAATVIANLLSSGDATGAAVFAVANTLEPVIIAYALEAVVGRPFRLDSLRAIGSLAAIAAAGAAIAALCGAIGLQLAGHSAAPTWTIWRTWFVADLVGIVAVAPLFVTVVPMLGARGLARREWIEGTILLLALAGIAEYLFGQSAMEAAWPTIVPLAFLFPMLLWIAARCAPVFAAAGSFLISVITVWNTIEGRGRFADSHYSLDERVLAAQAFMFTASLCALSLAIIIAERRRAESALRESAQRLQLAFSGAKAGSYEWDLTQGAVVGSPEYFGLYGLPRPHDYSPIEQWQSSIHPDDRARVAERLRTLFESAATSYEIEFRIFHPESGVRWILSRSHIDRAPDGRADHVRGINLDITERKQAESALQESEARLRQAEQIARIGYWIWHPDHPDSLTGTTEYSPEGAAILGRGPDALAVADAEFYDRMVRPDDRVRAQAVFEDSIRARAASFSVEHGIVKPDGVVRTIVSFGENSYDESGRIHHSTGAIQDVTERRQTEEQLRQSQKIEAVGRLTGGIAHDFNNLLTVVIGNLDLALGRVQSDLQATVEGALRAAERGAALVGQLLAFSRKQTLMPETIDLNRLVAGLRELLRRTLGEDIEIEMALEPELWPALADKGQVENALLNLAINARDAMPTGGRLLIETDNARLDEGYASRNEEVTPGAYAMLAVTDTGTGMAPAVVARAVEPFFTTKEVGKGSGLGLSMIYGFVKQSGGHLKIYSEVGHGTTVRLFLPRADQAAADEAAAAATPDHPRGHETVLAVEDDAEVRAFVVGRLRDLGYRVLEAADGHQALAILAGSDRIDLLFTDVVMPRGITGRELADEAKRQHPQMKILFTSGYTETAIVRHGRLDPSVHFLPKPFRRHDLAVKVREALDGP